MESRPRINQEIIPTANLKNIIDQKSLKWIFVGGKGGVGKTTVSSTLALALANSNEKILIMSTDPAHSLSDALNQKMGSTPTKVNGTENLYGLEIDPNKEDQEEISLEEVLGMNLDNDTKSIFDNLKNSVPGVDEALSIGMILQIVEKLNFTTVVFDTAPTGHTLRMLSFPAILEQAIQQLTMLSTGQNAGLAGALLNNPLLQNLGGIGNLIDMIKSFQNSIESIKKQFSDKEHTTFIAVCIPEFLSMYETERLIQELQKLNIDCHNIVINQVLFPDNTCPCEMCNARFEMQKKYIQQIREIYSDDMSFIDPNIQGGNDIQISILPFMENEIRGVEELKGFIKFLINH